jgi:hypothetical protein
MPIKIEADDEHPMPYIAKDEKADNFMDEMAVSAQTAEALLSLGANIEVDEEDIERQKRLLETAIKHRKVENFSNLPTAVGAAGFLRQYGQTMALDAAQARAAITTKLMEIANCGDIKYELKALELLGKHSDIGIFTERSEVTINYKNPEDLEHAIKERVKRLLNADIIDVTPLGVDLDEEFGFAEVPLENGDDESDQGGDNAGEYGPDDGSGVGDVHD